MATTYYIPSVNGWPDGKGYCFRLEVTREYDRATNVSSLSVKAQVNGAVGGNASAPLQIPTDTAPLITYAVNGGAAQTLRDYAVSPYARAIGAQNTWLDVCTNASLTTPQVYTFSAQHSSDGALSIDFAISGIRIWKNQVYYSNVMSGTGTLSVSEPRSSSIAAISGAVYATTDLSISMSRASEAFWHKATFTATGVNVTSAAFAASLSYTVPRSWFNSYPNAASFTLNVSVQTYTDSSCTTAVGSPVTAQVTVLADAGMVPVIGSGFVTAAACGNPAGLLGFIQGVSRAQFTLDGTKVTYANNAALGQFAVICQSYGEAGTGASYLSNVLTGSGTVAFTVSVTDSRGLAASWSGAITLLPYAPPTITGVEVFRCNISGVADADGTYYSAKGTAGCSSLNGQNSVSLQARLREAGGSWGAGYNLTSGTARVLGHGLLDPDKSYEVMLVATDALGNTDEKTVTLPTRQWAMKFRPNGRGVGFGKAPEHDKALEIPGDWKIIQGNSEGLLTLTSNLKSISAYFSDDGLGNDGINIYFTTSGGEIYELCIYSSLIGLNYSADGQTWVNKWVK